MAWSHRPTPPWVHPPGTMFMPAVYPCTRRCTRSKMCRGALFLISHELPAVWIEFETDYLASGSSLGGSPQESMTPPSGIAPFVYPILCDHRHLRIRYSNEIEV